MALVEPANDDVKASRIWLRSYPESVPHEIGPLQHRSLGGLFESTCRDHASKPGCISD